MTVALPAGFELVPLRRLGDLDLPVECDPRRRMRDGSLLYQRPGTTAFIATTLTRVVAKRPRGRDLDMMGTFAVHWYYPGYGCGFSGVGEDSEPGLDDSFLAVKIGLASAPKMVPSRRR